jgi:aminopeptidase N
VSEIFDQISYKKGGSIIRMMANFLGVEVFNKGIEEYLKKHKYENAQQVYTCERINNIHNYNYIIGTYLK